MKFFAKSSCIKYRYSNMAISTILLLVKSMYYAIIKISKLIQLGFKHSTQRLAATNRFFVSSYPNSLDQKPFLPSFLDLSISSNNLLLVSIASFEAAVTSLALSISFLFCSSNSSRSFFKFS